MAPATCVVLLATLCVAAGQLFPGQSLDYERIYGATSDTRYPTYAAPVSRRPPSRRTATAGYERPHAAEDAARRRTDYGPDLRAAAQHGGYGYDLYAQPSGYSQPSYHQPSYGYRDCSSLGTLSLLLGLGALAAFVIYFYIQSQMMMNRSLSSGPPLLEALRRRYPEAALLEALTVGACRALDALEADRAAEARGMSTDCLDGLIGPAAGFFALAAVVAFALAQAAQAGNRALGARTADSAALNASARKMLVALDGSDECVAWDLCRVTMSARSAPKHVQTPIKLASVAVAWYAARLRDERYSSYCWSLVDGLRGTCAAPDATCAAT